MNKGQFTKGHYGGSPCLGCTDRYVKETGERCHSTCEKYIAYVEKKDAVKAEKVADNREIRSYYRAHRVTQV